jgi:hypothetical protein
MSWRDHYANVAGHPPNGAWDDTKCKIEADRLSASNANAGGNNSFSTKNYTTTSKSASAEETILGIIVLIIGSIVYGLYRLYLLLAAWSALASPYRQVAGFYYYTVILPLETVVNGAIALSSLGPTPIFWVNLVIVGSVLLVVAAFFLYWIAKTLRRSIKSSTNVKRGFYLTVVLFLAPALIASFHALLSVLF